MRPAFVIALAASVLLGAAFTYGRVRAADRGATVRHERQLLDRLGPYGNARLDGNYVIGVHSQSCVDAMFCGDPPLTWETQRFYRFDGTIPPNALRRYYATRLTQLGFAQIRRDVWRHGSDQIELLDDVQRYGLAAVVRRPHDSLLP